MGKILVIYYSHEGNTKKVAEQIGRTLQADVQRIQPVDEIGGKTRLVKYLWGGKQVLMGQKPVLEPLQVNLDHYELIFLGTPIWAGTYSPAIASLLKDEKLKGKKIAYFYTHRGGASKAKEKGKQAINQNNECVSVIDFGHPAKNEELYQKMAIAWATNIARKLGMVDNQVEE